MRGDVIIVGLLIILIALILRMRTKYLSERIRTAGSVILGITIVVVGLVVNCNIMQKLKNTKQQ